MELMVDPRLAAIVDGDAGRGAPAPVGRVEAGGLVPAPSDTPQADAASRVDAGGTAPAPGDAPQADAVSRVDAGGTAPAPGDAPQADAVSCVEVGGSVCGGDAPRVAAVVGGVDVGGTVPAPGDAPRAAAVVVVGGVDVGGLTDRELDERLAALGRERSRVEGLLAVAAAEKHRRVGGRAAATMMREQLNVSARQASADTELAASLRGGFPATLAALCAGEITLGHARVISRAGADADGAEEASLLEMARSVPVDLFARMARRYERDTEDPCLKHRQQHNNRWASLVQDPDGSWRLSAYFGYDTGKRVGLAFEQMVRTYRNSACVNGIDRTDHLTAPQRRADALANLITGEGPHRRTSTTLLVIADYDTLTKELRDLRYDDGTPVPPDQIASIAAGAKILPAVFSAASGARQPAACLIVFMASDDV